MMGSKREKQGKGSLKDMAEVLVGWFLATFLGVVIFLFTAPMAVWVSTTLQMQGNPLANYILLVYAALWAVVYILILRKAIKEAGGYIDDFLDEIREFMRWLTEGGDDDRETP